MSGQLHVIGQLLGWTSAAALTSVTARSCHIRLALSRYHLFFRRGGLNGYLLYSLSENDDLEKQSKNEKHVFSIFICLWGVRYYLSAIESLGYFYDFSSVQQQSKLALEVVDKHHAEINESLKICALPKGWVNVVVDGI